MQAACGVAHTVCGVQVSPPVPRQDKADFANKQVEPRAASCAAVLSSSSRSECCCLGVPGGSDGAAALCLPPVQGGARLPCPSTPDDTLRVSLRP